MDKPKQEMFNGFIIQTELKTKKDGTPFLDGRVFEQFEFTNPKNGERQKGKGYGVAEWKASEWLGACKRLHEILTSVEHDSNTNNTIKTVERTNEQKAGDDLPW